MTITYTEQEQKQIELLKCWIKCSSVGGNFGKKSTETFETDWIKLIIAFKIRLGEKDAQVYIDKTCEMLKEYVNNKL